MGSTANRLLSLATLAALLCTPALGLAQNGRVRGMVRDAHSVPMTGATIRLTGGTGEIGRAHV